MLKDIRITQRFIAVVVIYSIAFAAVMGVSLWGLISARDSLKTVHDEAMKPALLAGESVDKIVQNRLQILLAFQHAPDSPLASIHTHPTTAHTEAIAANRTQANLIFKEMEASVAGAEEQAIFEQTKAARSPWRDKLDQVVKAIQAGDFSPATMAFFLQAGRVEGEAAVKALRKLCITFFDLC